MSRDENPHREKVIDSPSFEGFFAQLDCRLTYDNNWELNTGNTRKESIVSCSKTEKNRNDERYGQLAHLLEFILIMNHAEVHCSSRAILMFLWIRLSFTHIVQALNSLFPNCYVKQLACFCELQFGRISRNKSFSFYIRDLKLQAKLSNSTCRRAFQFIRECKLLTLMVWHFWQL